MRRSPALVPDRRLIYRGIKEKDFQAQVIHIAQLCGWLVHHEFDSRRSTAGYPDLSLVHALRRQYIMVELKTERGRVRPEQQMWIEALRASGIECHVWRPHDIDRIIVRLQH